MQSYIVVAFLLGEVFLHEQRPNKKKRVSELSVVGDYFQGLAIWVILQTYLVGGFDPSEQY